jgi:hypothetical protein
MNAQSPLSKDDPLLIAWKAHQQTPEYDNSKRWAQTFMLCNSRDDPSKVEVQYCSLEGSLWAMFVAGWNARADFSASG